MCYGVRVRMWSSDHYLTMSFFYLDTHRHNWYCPSVGLISQIDSIINLFDYSTESEFDRTRVFGVVYQLYHVYETDVSSNEL